MYLAISIIACSLTLNDKEYVAVYIFRHWLVSRWHKLAVEFTELWMTIFSYRISVCLVLFDIDMITKPRHSQVTGTKSWLFSRKITLEVTCQEFHHSAIPSYKTIMYPPLKFFPHFYWWDSPCYFKNTRRLETFSMC